MVWLHSWLGLTAGWILYFVFLTGTTGYLHFEISRWMRPELPLVSGITAPAETLTAAQRYLSEHAAGADFWVISFPGHRGSEELAVSWRSQRSASMGGGDVVQATLNPLTGERVERRPRSTGGGTTLYIMHYALHYISRDKGTLIVGAAAMTMLVAILSGIVAHKKSSARSSPFGPPPDTPAGAVSILCWARPLCRSS